MILRATIFLIVILCSCRSGLIDCPEVKGARAKRTIINTKSLKPEDLYVSSSLNKKNDYKAYERLREQRKDIKNAQSIEEWDCPRPGQQKNSKIVKGNIRRMEKKMEKDIESRMQQDSLSVSPVYP